MTDLFKFKKTDMIFLFEEQVAKYKKEWMEIKQKAVTSARQIAGIIEETFKKDNTKQLDF